ncbi:MAG TPA: LCP family protein, partial [Desulfitobacteriaceae bacterium]|nr:LCP family protein [Desulfitobacteriaceae bacterium]
ANVDTHQVSVISIPRDTRVKVAGVGLTKITHANAVGESKGGIREGALESAKAVSDFFRGYNKL